MEAMVQISVLLVATLLAVAASLGLNWFFLRTAFYLMQPAAVRPVAVAAMKPSGLLRPELVHGTRALAQQFMTHR